jgi:hypothetical protein
MSLRGAQATKQSRRKNRLPRSPAFGGVARNDKNYVFFSTLQFTRPSFGNLSYNLKLSYFFTYSLSYFTSLFRVTTNTICFCIVPSEETAFIGITFSPSGKLIRNENLPSGDNLYSSPLI